MQIHIIVLMMGLLSYELVTQTLKLDPWMLSVHSPWIPGDYSGMLVAMLGMGLLLKLVAMAVCAWGCQWAYRTMQRKPSRAGMAIQFAERWCRMTRQMLVILFLFDLYVFGWIEVLQPVLGTFVLPQLVVLCVTLTAYVGSFGFYHRIDTRLRELALISRLDRGLPIYAPVSRGQFILLHLRTYILPLLVPILIFYVYSEMLYLLPTEREYMQVLLHLAGGGVIFLLAPLMLRHVWDTEALPEGSLRQRLLGLCEHHGIRVRQLLVWKTHGMLVNAAVMGLIAPLRHILMTDALIESMNPRHIEAVMAHEIAHVRYHHMFWLGLCAIAPMSVFLTFIEWAMLSITGLPSIEALLSTSHVMDSQRYYLSLGMMVLFGLGMAIWLLWFGLISRIFERQADAFAVKHFATKSESPNPGVVDPPSVGVMGQALYRVAELNYIDPTRRSFRHGSMAQRVEHLQLLIDQPVEQLSIDQQARRVRIFGGVCAVVLIVVSVM